MPASERHLGFADVPEHVHDIIQAGGSREGRASLTRLATRSAKRVPEGERPPAERDGIISSPPAGGRVRSTIPSAGATAGSGHDRRRGPRGQGLGSDNQAPHPRWSLPHTRIGRLVRVDLAALRPPTEKVARMAHEARFGSRSRARRP